MDIEKLLTLLPQFFSDYFSAFIQTLQKPTMYFQPIRMHQPSLEIAGTFSSQRRHEPTFLNPKLFSFIVLSIFLGSVIQSVTPKADTALELPTLIIFVAIVWLVMSSVIFLFCKMFGGRGSYFDTISIGLQLIAVIYVIASLIALFVMVISSIFYGELESPYPIYITSQTVLFLIYLPLALKNLHFSSSRKDRIALALATASSILVILIIVIILASINIFVFMLLG